MKVHLINPSDTSFGTAVVTPRWLYVLAAATPRSYGDPVLVDEGLERTNTAAIAPGDVVGIGIHTTNAYRGYQLGNMARAQGAYVVYGGIHATLYPQEAIELGGAHAVVQGDGDLVWPKVLEDCAKGTPLAVYSGGRIEAGDFAPARWELIPRKKYMWASVQTVRGCPKHCSFCSVWRTDGQKPRQRASDSVIKELVQLRQLGFRYIVLADDNFYPVTLEDLRLASQQKNQARLNQLNSLRQERFELMSRMAMLPSDMIFFTQITMEATEDPEFLKAMHSARIRGVLVGVEAVTPAGLKDVYKDFNTAGENLVDQLQQFRRHGVYVLGSFIFGLPSDRPETFQATADVAGRAGLAFAQFVTLTPFPGTVDFNHWEEKIAGKEEKIAGIPITRRWLIPPALRPKIYWPHPVMSGEEIRRETQAVWDKFYSWRSIWQRSNFIRSKAGRLAFLLISRIYRHMYADTGIATDSARVAWSTRWTRILAKPCQMLFAGRPMPDLTVPDAEMGFHAPVFLDQKATTA
ncbi:MAG TPA: radical SAM protein [Terriglobales bacterium]|nr:radical SAM protein [Terriglobales bacterium]